MPAGGTIILDFAECYDYRLGPSLAGTLEVRQMQLSQEMLAPVGHAAFKLEELLHLPPWVLFFTPELSPEVGGSRGLNTITRSVSFNHQPISRNIVCSSWLLIKKPRP